MTVKMCRACTIRKAISENANDGVKGLCGPCFDEAGWENTHSDYGHDDVAAGTVARFTPDDLAATQEQMVACWICHPELNEAKAPARKGHTNTAPTSGIRRDHSGCAHPRTPKGRAACRKAGGPIPADEAPKLTTIEWLMSEVKKHATEHYNDPAPAAWDVVIEATEDDELAEMIGKAKTIKGAIRNVKSRLAPYADKRADIQATEF